MTIVQLSFMKSCPMEDNQFIWLLFMLMRALSLNNFQTNLNISPPVTIYDVIIRKSISIYNNNIVIYWPMGLAKKFQILWQIEKLRYSRKGVINIIIAVFLLIMILWGAAALCRAVWPQKIQNKQWFTGGISFCIHFFFQALYFLIYAPGYSKSLKFYQNYRITKGVDRPWENNPKWPQLKKRLFYYLGLNYFIVYPLSIFISTKLSGIKTRFEDLPTAFQLAWQLLFVAFVQDAGFYWAHRLTHEFKFMYKFHKIHHEYTQTFSLVTQFTHPIDYIFGVLIPSAIPFVLLGGRAHCFMFFFWQVWKIFISTEGHCGYYFPWSPTRIFFFVSEPSFHDYHHRKNIGNYCGSIYLWDYFNGSAQSYFTQYGIDFKNKQN